MKEEKKLSRAINKFLSKNGVPGNGKEQPITKEAIIELLVEGISNLERGLCVLDRNLIITKQPLDVLAVDLVGELVIIEVETEETEAVILRALEHFDWILNNVNSIVHKYNRDKLDVTLAPRIIIVSRSFSEDFLRKLTYVNTTRIDLYEFEMKDEEGITKLRFIPHAFALAENRTIEINKPRIEDLVNFIKVGFLRQFCHRIIKEMRVLNKDVLIDTSSGYIDIRRNENSLARIYPQPNFFWIGFNPRGKWQGIKVEEEAQFDNILGEIKKIKLG